MSTYIEYTVEGKGEFPFDMLRRDQSYPTTEVSAMLMSGQFRHQRLIVLTCAAPPSKYWVPTERRWQSFGWEVTNIREVRS